MPGEKGGRARLKIAGTVLLGGLGLLLAGCGDGREAARGGAPLTGLAALFGGDARGQAAEAKTFTVGERVRLENVALTINEVEVSGGDEKRTPPDKRHVQVQFTVENLGDRPEYLSAVQFGLLYDLSGSARKQLLTAHTGEEWEGQFAPGRKVQGAIAWEVPAEATGLRVVFDDSVLATRVDGDLVNGPLTIIVPRRGNGKAVFAIGGGAGRG